MVTRRIESTLESRRLLMEAAAELFAEKGYRQTSFIDIAERAGISRGSIPWHFGNKLGLLKAVVEDHLRLGLASFARTDDQASEQPLDSIVRFIRLPATGLFITLLSEAVEEGSPLQEHYARLHSVLRQALQEQIPTGVLPPGVSPEAFAVLLVGMVIGVHAQWRVAPTEIDLDAFRSAVGALFPWLAG
jgi:TetR/AcrR family acrAB operon transcriptional repressor